MRILFLGNNWVGWQVLAWLRECHEEIVGVVLHPSPKRRYGEAILEAAGLGESSVFDGSRLRDPEVVHAIRALVPDIGVSILFDYILEPEFIGLAPRGIVNMHPAYLPYNRGQYPNVWSIIDGTPAGATLHYIDKGIDTGDIIAQREVGVEPVDTGESLYRKLERASVELFKDVWPSIKAGNAPRRRQDGSGGTYHRTGDVGRIDEIQLDATYTARDLINILRARTFPPYDGTYFLVNGKRVNLRLELKYEQDS